MPVKIPDQLPAAQILARENIFVMTSGRADAQDIRPLRIAVLNLMPTKLETETQLLRVLGNTPLQVEVTLLHTATYLSKNTDKSHLDAFYRTFGEIKDQQFDGLVITGAPVEELDFAEIEYWDELAEIMDWAEKNVFSTMYICWAAQAALHYHYGIKANPRARKLSGVYPHRRLRYDHKLLRGFDDIFYAPHSRYNNLDEKEIAARPELDVLAMSDTAGLYLAASKDGRRIFVTGHGEYDAKTLALEYQRDVDAGLNAAPPEHYFPGDDPSQPPAVCWRAHGNLLFSNWLNYFVYQETPYNIKEIAGGNSL